MGSKGPKLQSKQRTKTPTLSQNQATANWLWFTINCRRLAVRVQWSGLIARRWQLTAGADPGHGGRGGAPQPSISARKVSDKCGATGCADEALQSVHYALIQRFIFGRQFAI